MADTPLDRDCPACGFSLDVEPWDGDLPSDEICPSCGIQFGYHDAGRRSPAFYAGWLARWVTEGMPWWSSRPAPERWSRAEQVARVGLPGQVSGSPVAQYVQVRDDGTVDVRLGPRWAIFNEALADAVTSLPPRGSPERRLSTYWIDQTLSRLAAFRHGGEGGVVASGNAYSISVSENHVTAMWDYGDADTSERMTIAEFVEILEGWRRAVIATQLVEQREVPETYRRNPWP